MVLPSNRLRVGGMGALVGRGCCVRVCNCRCLFLHMLSLSEMSAAIGAGFSVAVLVWMIGRGFSVVIQAASIASDVSVSE
jgi:hypothetical protein